MITRRTRIQRTTRIRKRRGTRRGPWRSEIYRRWVASLPCVICHDERTQAAHTVNNGRSSKGPDSSCIPLCPFHHDQLDGRRDMNGHYGKASFERAHGVILAELSAGFFEVWQARNNPEPACECVFSGDQADVSACDLHNPSSRYNRMRPELPQTRTTEDVGPCPF